MIKKINGKYVVKSHTTGMIMGTYKTKTEAKNRLKQIKYFGGKK